MVTLKIVALIGLCVGLFLLFNISFVDFTGGIFNGLLAGPKGIREEILEETSRKKKSIIRREIDETRNILENTERLDKFPLICTASLTLFAIGAVIAIFLENYFLVPVFAIGFMFIPFWYIKLTASNYKKNVAAELETALSIITTAYLRNEDIITSVEENVRHLNPPVRNAFEEFVTKVRMVNPNVEEALDELKGKINNDVFKEWVDAMKACLYDRSLKNTLVPIVAKLSDTRIVNAELDYMVKEPRKEFATMVGLVIFNIPLLYILNKDWYHTLMHTIPGQITLAVCGALIFISTAFVIKLTKPIDYKN